MNERELFLSALEIEDPVARRAHVQAACAGDAQLLDRVESLLQSHEGPSQFLNTPAIEQIAGQTRAEATLPFASGSTEDGEGDAADSPFHGFHPMKTHADQQADEIPLGFLAPPSRSDSLGRLGHYEVLEVLGRGAFGIVLKAFDEKLHRGVAIKVLSPEMAATSPARKRFLREARSSARIRHENVVSIYAVEDEPIPYLVMEYVPGETLQKRLDDHGPLDLADVLRLGKQIADALAAAHAQQLIHRDIKPGNILLDTSVDDRVKITDFGLARTADDANMTQSGMIAGTPMYMAPEQAHGQKLDQRADLFSFGSVLYQMISGRPPFRAPTTVAVLKRVAEDTPRPIQEIIAEVPDWMCQLIGHLHAKNPDERYNSASEVSELLAQCLADVQAGRKPRIPAPSQQSGSPLATVVVRAKAERVSPGRTKRALHRPLAAVAIFVLLLIVGLGITEATGVTKLASTVIRWTTPDGILVIETDDPSVKIAIDGEEITIQGGGIAELKLRPGDYTVTAAKDGKQVQQEIVSVTRNGRVVVKLSLEPPAEPPTTASGSPSLPKPEPIQWPADAPPPAIAPFDAAQAKQHQQAWADYLDVPVEQEIQLGRNRRGLDVKLSLVLIPPGELLMGSSDEEIAKLREQATASGISSSDLDWIDLEGPQRRVRISRPFYLSKNEFTTEQFRTFVQATEYKTEPEASGQGAWTPRTGTPGRDPKYNWKQAAKNNPQGPDSPVVNVTWNDANKCCEWLSQHDAGLMFALPTEAQWEYACRAGTTTLWSTGDEESSLENYAVINTNWPKNIGDRLPNAFGLCDMHGNVWEWCQDAFYNYRDAGSVDPIGAVEGERRILRGGACFGGFKFSDNWMENNGCRSAVRYERLPDNPLLQVGFRVAAAIPDELIQQRLAAVGDKQKRRFASDEWIDVISLIDPELDKLELPGLTGENQWQVSDGELRVGHADTRPHKLLIPLDAAWPAFECELEVTRRAGSSGFCVNIPSVAGDCPVVFDWPGRPGHFVGSSARGARVAEDAALETGERTAFRIEVRQKDGDDHVKLWRNGAYLGEWTGDRSKATTRLDTRFPADRRTSLYVWGGGSEFTFHRIRIRMLDGGTAITLRPVPAKQTFEWPAHAPPLAIAPFDAEQAKQHQKAWAEYLGVPVEYTNAVGMKFALIPPSRGSDAPEAPIYAGVYEVTVGQFRRFVKESGYKSEAEQNELGGYWVRGVDENRVGTRSPEYVWSHANMAPTDDHPVGMMTWRDAQAFCEWLSRTERQTYRLPTDAEWEWAASGGAAGRYYFGKDLSQLNEHAWYLDNSERTTHPVGLKKANPWGLYDVYGNIFELCYEWMKNRTDREMVSVTESPSGPSSSAYQIVRGGSYHDATSGGGGRISGEAPYSHVGFRVVLLIEPPGKASGK